MLSLVKLQPVPNSAVLNGTIKFGAPSSKYIERTIDDLKQQSESSLSEEELNALFKRSMVSVPPRFSAFGVHIP